jgi:hypothetical protein
VAVPCRLRQGPACRQYRAARIAAGAEDDGLSQTIEATEDPAVLVAAITRRWETRLLTVEDVVAGGRQFAVMPQRPGITPEVNAALAGYLARASAVRLLSAALQEGRPASLSEADRVVALAEVSYRDSPGQSVVRITLASALLLRGRPEETGRCCPTISDVATAPRTCRMRRSSPRSRTPRRCGHRPD